MLKCPKLETVTNWEILFYELLLLWLTYIVSFFFYIGMMSVIAKLYKYHV